MILSSTGAEAIRSAPEFAVFRGLDAKLPEAAFKTPELLPFYLRHALETAWFIKRGIRPALADIAAARSAARFAQADPALAAALPEWVQAMAGDAASATQETAEIRGIWALLDTADALMETGGDIRLARDPRTELNGYGCSHRPRPWAITFASSTASSSSERGFEAADRARLHCTLQLLRGVAPRLAIRRLGDAVRHRIASAFGLAAGDKIILAASGTDTELLALAITHLDGRDAPIVNILIAPEETGRGVPMAAKGLHFAVDTALGHDVTSAAPIAGFRPDTRLASIALRDEFGALRAIENVEAEIENTVATAIGQGCQVILHELDLSKTGLLAPRPAFLKHLRSVHGGSFDIVVDACQARLSPASLRDYLALDATVLITGSKFFTGPPFAGAAILPAAIAARLNHAMLPEGLDAYFGRDDFPVSCHAASKLPAIGNYGLALRWHAALAEIRALSRVPPRRRAEILQGFGDTVRAAIRQHPALQLLEAPAIARHAGDEPWERLPSIFTFSLRAPLKPSRCLNPAEARLVYLWLNTDLSSHLPSDSAVAARICHIGQPVPLPQPAGGGLQGALRVSAGARLISGEPAHRGLAADARLAREFADLALVFDKIALILANWTVLCVADPAPCYRPAQAKIQDQSPAI